ncbi:MAG: hypothetical protein FWE01_00815 [Firmicutes bacterium]|nr:hypothetical protein [Bacillota bacterium]
MGKTYGRGFLSLLAFIAFALVGFAFMLFMIIRAAGWNDSIAHAFYLIGIILACIVIGVISFIFCYRRMRRQWWCMLVWTIAAIFITIALILGETGVI